MSQISLKNSFGKEVFQIGNLTIILKLKLFLVFCCLNMVFIVQIYSVLFITIFRQESGFLKGEKYLKFGTAPYLKMNWKLNMYLIRLC